MSPPLGDIDTETFLARDWQRRPRLIRQAVPDIAGLVSMPTLRRLAADTDVESRLVRGPGFVEAERRGRGRTSSRGSGSGSGSGSDSGAGWRLAHGPFTRLPALARGGWTLLLQGLDTHLDEARALMDRFRFIPDARIDDLMLSFASDGGGVGPHVDAYDVFLLQVQGRREWRIGPPDSIRRDAAGNALLVPQVPLRLIERFDAQSTWTLEPGDMLYLPPGWAHDGIARGACMTCSIGFRAPSRGELLQAFFGWLADQPAAELDRGSAGSRRGPQAPGRSPRYSDPGLAPSVHPARIPPGMAATLGGWLQEWRAPDALFETFLGTWLTEPKPNVWFDHDDSRDLLSPEPQSPELQSPELQSPDPRKSGRTGSLLRLDRRSRMLYRDGRFFLNGECFEPPASARRLLARLADRRTLATAEVAEAVADRWLGLTLDGWLKAGWITHAGK